MRLVVADDHPLYLDAVRGHLARAFRGADLHFFSTLDNALAFLAQNSADLVMLDYSMPGMDGTDGVRRAVAAAGAAPVVVMSGIASGSQVGSCIAAGAKGFLPKTMDAQVFTDAVALVLHGGTYVPAEFMGHLPHVGQAVTVTAPAEGEETAADFSPREVELMRMMASGASNKEIARKMALQEVTVKFYLTRLFRRLGVKNRSQAAVTAARLGLGGTSQPPFLPDRK